MRLIDGFTVRSAGGGGVTPTPAAFSALALRDSIGVGVAPGYTDGANYDTARLFSHVIDLGVPRIRGAITRSPPAYYVDFYQQAADAGIKVNLIAGDPEGRDSLFAAGESALLVSALKTTWASIAHQLEGPNEWDTKGSGWQDTLRSFYAEYRAAIRADPALNHLVYYGGSMAQGNNFDTYIDANQEGAVLHPYPGGEMPEVSAITGQVAKARASAGAGKPVIATEMGYNNGFNTSTQGNIGLPEEQDAHYTVREFVYNFCVLGISQNYKYVMSDYKPNDPNRVNTEAWYGLLAVEGDPAASKTTWTLRKKPSYLALQRLLAYLQDAGTGPLPNSLPFEVSANPNAAYVIPIARRDGSYDLAVWLKNRLWNTATISTPQNRALIADTVASVGLRFGGKADVELCRPSVGDEVTRVGTGVTSLNVVANGKVAFLRVRPVS